MHDTLKVKEMKRWIEKHKNKDGNDLAWRKRWEGVSRKDGESKGIRKKKTKDESNAASKSLQGDKKQEDTAVCPSETSFELSTVKNIFLIFPQ